VVNVLAESAATRFSITSPHYARVLLFTGFFGRLRCV
jgi:hypothetical protein